MIGVPSGWRRAAAVAGLSATLLSGCAVAPRAVDAGGQDLLSGRLSVRVDAAPGSEAHSVSAGFELAGDARSGRLDLTSPLGSVLAQARWAPDRVVLRTPKGETDFADLDSLTREALGESVPVAALFDWLRGRPWPGASSSPTTPPAEPGFHQLGWTVSLARFGEAWVDARRERAPAVTVRARLDRP